MIGRRRCGSGRRWSGHFLGQMGLLVARGAPFCRGPLGHRHYCVSRAFCRRCVEGLTESEAGRGLPVSGSGTLRPFLRSSAPTRHNIRAEGSDGFTESPATSRRWFCLPFTWPVEEDLGLLLRGEPPVGLPACTCPPSHRQVYLARNEGLTCRDNKVRAQQS